MARSPNIIQPFDLSRRRWMLLYSGRWGDARRTPLPFTNTASRMRAAAKAQGISREARLRLEWMLWYAEHGGNARMTCRHFGIAPKVFYAWRKRFDGKSFVTLETRSRRPRRLRQSTITPLQEERICALRRTYMHYSKMKLQILYHERHEEKISSWKIQKVIERHRLYPHPARAASIAAKRRQAWKKKRITELVTRPRPGFVVGIDTIVLWIQGTKRYVITAVDRFSRLAFARMYTTHSSLTAADFLRRLKLLLGEDLRNIQTDNGSEFHLHFEAAIRELKLQHWWSRVKTPKDNAICERFNRTIQEEFIALGNAYTDPVVFNRKATEWLLEYNFHRPHTALGYRRPIEIACPGHQVLPMYSSHTPACETQSFRLQYAPMAVIRQTEIHQRRVRKMKLKKLRAKYVEAKGAVEKEKIVSKVAKIAPWLSEEEFAGVTKKK